MNVLVACECSGRVKTAFRKLGHNAWSCDLKPSEIVLDPYHFKCDVKRVFQDNRHTYTLYGGTPAKWDLLIAHPDCTYLAVSGARWWKDRIKEQMEAIDFVKWIWNLPVHHIAIENPIGKLSTAWLKPDQIIQPWQFGHGEVKATCLWLKGLPILKPTNIVDGRYARVHLEPPSPDRKANRARTYQGIAEAMAEQWGSLGDIARA